MKSKNLFLLAFFSIFTFLFSNFSCKNTHGHAPSSDPLYHEVMAIHDDVMPKMSTMHHYKKELKKAIDTSPTWKDSILTVIHTLDEADESMMLWMEKFSMPAKPEEAKSYLTAEKVKIQEVSDDMYKAMNLAKTLLDTLHHE